MEQYSHRIKSLVIPTFKVEDIDMIDGEVGILKIKEPCRVIVRVPYAKHNLGTFPKNFTEAVYKQPIWVKDDGLNAALENVYSLVKYYILPSTFNLDIENLSNEQIYYLLLFLSRSGYFTDNVTSQKITVTT